MTPAADRIPARLASGALAVLIAVAAAVWLSYGLTGRSITTDDGISLLAARGIRLYGYPLLESGLIYDRGYLAHYLLAASTAVFGVNDFGILAPSCAAALGTVALTALLGRRALGEAATGLLGAALLVPCGVLVMYATSPRFYALLLFWSTLAVYAAWRGYAEGSARHRWLAILAVALGLQCELGAGTLVVALPIALVAASHRDRSLRERLSALVPRRPAEIAALVALGVSVALVTWRPENHLEFLVAQSGRTTDFLGLNPYPGHITRHFGIFDGLLPGTMPLAIAGFAAFWAMPELRRPGFVYLGVVWFVATTEVGFVMNGQAHRFVLFLLPLYALLVAQGAVSVGRSLLLVLTRTQARSEGAATLVTFAVAGSIGLYAYGHFRDEHLGQLADIYDPGWGLPDHNVEGNYVFKHELKKLKAKLGADDIVLSSNPWVTDYYLGRTDGMLRQHHRADDSWGRFREDRDEYFGADIVDDPLELDGIASRLVPGQSLWLLTDRKLTLFSSKEFQKHVWERGRQVNKSTRIKVIQVTVDEPVERP